MQIECLGEKITKEVTKGCPQGSVCGPIFWDVTLEPCLNMLINLEETIGVVAYADDIAIVGKAESRRNLEAKAKTVLEKLHTWCHEQTTGYLSIAKTTYMLFKGGLKRNPTIKLNNTPIKRSTSTKYLGIIIDERLNYQQHIKYICNKTYKIMNKIISIGQRRFHLPLPVIRTYHNGILSAIMTYGASVWGHRVNCVTNEAAVNRTQRKILIRLCGAYRTSPQNALLVTMGITPIHLIILRRAATYWLRKHNNNRASEIMLSPVNSILGIKYCVMHGKTQILEDEHTKFSQM